jgi:hypothetical protein
MGKDDVRDPGTDGRIMFRWILKGYIMKIWARFMWFRMGIRGGFL